MGKIRCYIASASGLFDEAEGCGKIDEKAKVSGITELNTT